MAFFFSNAVIHGEWVWKAVDTAISFLTEKEEEAAMMEHVRWGGVVGVLWCCGVVD